MTAVLNIAYGACATQDVLVALQNAHDMLYTCNASLFAKNTASRNTAISLASFLDSYTSGLIGPGSCVYVQPTINTRNVRSVSAYEQILDRMVAMEQIIRGDYTPFDDGTLTRVEGKIDTISTHVNALTRVEGKIDTISTHVNAFQCPSVSTGSIESRLQQLHSSLSRLSTADVQADLLVLFGEIGELVANSTDTLVCKDKYGKSTRDLAIATVSIVSTILLALLAYFMYRACWAPVVVVRTRT